MANSWSSHTGLARTSRTSSRELRLGNFTLRADAIPALSMSRLVYDMTFMQRSWVLIFFHHCSDDLNALPCLLPRYMVHQKNCIAFRPLFISPAPDDPSMRRSKPREVQIHVRQGLFHHRHLRFPREVLFVNMDVCPIILSINDRNPYYILSVWQANLNAILISTEPHRSINHCPYHSTAHSLV